MPGKRIDKLKKERYKQARLQGESIKGSLLNAGYSEASARGKNSALSVVKVCEKELMTEIKAKDITVEWVINQLTRELIAPDAKASDRIRVSELLGKYLNMFKDSQSPQVVVFTNDITKDLPCLDITPKTEPPALSDCNAIG